MKSYIVVIISVMNGRKYPNTVEFEAKDKWELLGKIYDKYGENLESFTIVREEE